ncbi:MAG TPA: CHAT domain-containing protein, partial [Candidatus Eisenbacteria bacterium]|nr:CHAT domain-containing protein [Candidatus Eisenbacteria bacterium]
ASGRFFGDDVLQLMIVGGADHETEVDRENPDAQILAMYGSARAVERFPTRNESRPSSRRTFDGEAGTRYARIISRHQRIRMRLEGRAEEQTGKVPGFPTGDELCDFGADLFHNLFVGRVQRLYDVARSEQRDRPLNLIFTCSIPWLASLPWEFAFDPIRRKFLVTEELHFIRNVLTTVPAQTARPMRTALQILVVSAQPLGTQELSLEEEEARIRSAFRRLDEAGLVAIEVLQDVTPDRLHRTIESASRERRAFDVVHFMGHGDYDSKANEGILVFTDATGVAQDVTIRALREILVNRGVGLVFLNACDTARDDSPRLNRGVAQALVEAGLPAVVANQYPVLDPSAVGFSEHFYWSLATGGTLGEAAREARIALNYSIEGEAIDWAVPVLYARDPNYRLCQPRRMRPERARARGRATARSLAASPLGTHPTSMVGSSKAAARHSRTQATRKQRAEPKTLRVGVADLTRFFSGLEPLLARMNRAQQRLAFNTVELTVPLGVWRQSRESEEEEWVPGRSYFDADAFAARLANKPAELKVDLLVAITDQWMMCEESGAPLYNIFGWWRGDPKIMFIIFSIAGLPMRSAGPQTDRMLANFLVGGIAAKLLEESTGRPPIHKRGPRSCPFFYNPDREVELMEGLEAFDAKCRQGLQKGLSAKLEPVSLIRAFDALLRLDVS